MNQLNIKEVYEYVETHISIFHQKRLEYVQNNIDLNKILKQKNPYLFRAKNILTAQDLVKGFIDAFLLSQEETLFGQFIEGLAIFVCDKVYQWHKGSSISQIKHSLGIDRKTIRKYIDLAEGQGFIREMELQPYTYYLDVQEFQCLRLLRFARNDTQSRSVIARSVSDEAI